MSVQRQIDRLVAYQAAEWFERLNADAEDGNPDFVRWISESPRHMEAFLTIAGQANVIRKVFADGSFDTEAILRSVSPEVVPLSSLEEPPPDQSALPANHQRVPLRLKLSAAAAVAAVLVIGTGLLYSASTWQHFETPIGEQRTIALTEGSVVNLNAFSRVDVKFSAAERNIRLQHGEATFKVAKDPRRPFRVHTPDAVIEAVGTQFNVYAKPDGTTAVTVLEGQVNVVSRGSLVTLHPKASVPLSAGEGAHIASSGHIEREEHTDAEDAIAWQQRKLIFKRTTLGDMASEFNRYNRSTQIRLEGIEPDSLRFTGAFNADDPNSLAALLSKESDLVVERRDGEIVIRRNASGEAAR